MDPSSFCSVFVAAPSLNVARKIATITLKERLAACANIVPKIESHYWWQGNLESTSEVLVIFKTAREKVKDLEACVLKNHPYQTPEFIALSIVEGNEKYLSWIAHSLGLAVPDEGAKPAATD